MNFQGKAVLVFLEEDNIARAYFRVRPLMTDEGAVSSEALAAFPDGGYLRIVPDKNEQHTFKERMRSMCGLCIMDLRHMAPEANKIRTNKNYSPSRGETNQFIVYSDAVRVLPDDLLYQVVSQEDVQNAVTPRVYIRSGANIQGPFNRETSQPVGEAAQLPPDSNEIHSLQYNGQELLFYWPRIELPPQVQDAPVEIAVEAPAPINAYEQIQELNAALPESANRLHEQAAVSVDFSPEQAQKPLVGTRFYQMRQPMSPYRRAHNSLVETVDQQRNPSRYETRYEAPGAVLPRSAELRDVQNPVDAFKRALANVCQTPEMQQQAVTLMLAQASVRSALAKSLSDEKKDLTIAAMHSQLQELEAERLMTLMQLDDAKKNLDAFKEETLRSASKAEQAKLDELKALQQKAREAVDAANASLAPIEEKRKEAAEALEKAGSSALVAAAGVYTPKAALIERMEKSLQAAGFSVENGDALAMLTAYALSPDGLLFIADTTADAHSALLAFAAALGAPYYDAGNPEAEFTVLPGGNSPVFVAAFGNKAGITMAEARCADLSAMPWIAQSARLVQRPRAALTFHASQEAVPRPLPGFPAVSKDSLPAELLKESEVSPDALAVLTAVRKELASLGKPLPLALAGMMHRFISATQNDFTGGVAEAIDRAVSIFAVPHMRLFDVSADEISSLLAAMPRSLAAMK